jgi:hypothetical protein
MKSCVIFAASIFNSSKMNVLREFCLSFKEHFSDADFYIGINTDSIQNMEKEIEQYGLNCKMRRVPGDLYTKTDASAYQTALQLLKESNKYYDIYWFAHTKGGVNSRDTERKMYLDNMISKRKEIEDMFEKYPQLGSWGIRGNSISAAGVEWKNYDVDSNIPICKNVVFPPFNKTHVNWSYIETLYVLKKEPVEAFLAMAPYEFFTTKLNPWYFETVMPWIAPRCGYFPYVKIKRDFWDKCDLTDITKEWINENNLPLQNYLNL